MKNNNPIGIFDSGIGGLTIARAIKRKLPNESLIYFGDTQHLPYGDKSSKSIVFFSEQIINFLRAKKCKAIIVACNSASSYLPISSLLISFIEYTSRLPIREPYFDLSSSIKATGEKIDPFLIVFKI